MVGGDVIILRRLCSPRLQCAAAAAATAATSMVVACIVLRGCLLQRCTPLLVYLCTHFSGLN